jgi:hypothetical protein
VTAHLLSAPAAPETVTIRSVTFLSQERACQLPNVRGDLGLPLGAPLCFVVLKGSFADLMRVTTYLYAVAVFNGVTGNYLGWSLTNSLLAALAGPAMPTS